MRSIAVLYGATLSTIESSYARRRQQLYSPRAAAVFGMTAMVIINVLTAWIAIAALMPNYDALPDISKGALQSIFVVAGAMIAIVNAKILSATKDLTSAFGRAVRERASRMSAQTAIWYPMGSIAALLVVFVSAVALHGGY